jgi:hypothetical protein
MTSMPQYLTRVIGAAYNSEISGCHQADTPLAIFFVVVDVPDLDEFIGSTSRDTSFQVRIDIDSRGWPIMGRQGKACG